MLIQKNHDLIHYYSFKSGDERYTYLVAYIRHEKNRTRTVSVRLIDNSELLYVGCLRSVVFSYLCYKFSIQQLVRESQKYFNQFGLTYELFKKDDRKA